MAAYPKCYDKNTKQSRDSPCQISNFVTNPLSSKSSEVCPATILLFVLKQIVQRPEVY